MDRASRHQARERALTLLYEAELKGEPVSHVVDGLPMAPDAYAAALVHTVEDRQAEIDTLVGEAAIGWELERMAVVDRNVLRLALAELLGSPDVPTAVILDEAVELAAVYSTDDSGRFVNGVLATLAARVREPKARAGDGEGDGEGGGEGGGQGIVGC
jgi:N utilization substance protein B